MTGGRVAVVAALGLVLAGCGDSQDELRDWMEKQKAATPLLKDRLQEPKSFKPFRYDGSEVADPFSPAKIRLVADQPVDAGRQTGPKPDTNRRREPLESFPLDIIRMVGHVTSAGQTFALLQVESVVYQVKTGNYVGPHFGRIVKVTENEVTLREIVQDGTGDWAERENSLRLAEGSK
jgi:type IV pilus assembly protein PilP